jgi:hypothetical protein
VHVQSAQAHIGSGKLCRVLLGRHGSFRAKHGIAQGGSALSQTVEQPPVRAHQGPFGTVEAAPNQVRLVRQHLMRRRHARHAHLGAEHLLRVVQNARQHTRVLKKLIYLLI